MKATYLHMNKCCAPVFDNLTRRERKCKKKFNFIIENCKYCHLHANIYYKQYISRIQAVFRGYKQRRMLQYFKLMPCDIQFKIPLKMQLQASFKFKFKVLLVILQRFCVEQMTRPITV